MDAVLSTDRKAAKPSPEDVKKSLPLLVALDKEHLSPLLLTAILRKSYDDTAALLNVKKGTLKSRVSRARAAFRTMILDKDRVPHIVNLSGWNQEPADDLAKAKRMVYEAAHADVPSQKTQEWLLRLVKYTPMNPPLE